jgi:hypothetical protein
MFDFPVADTAIGVPAKRERRERNVPEMSENKTNRLHGLHHDEPRR